MSRIFCIWNLLLQFWIWEVLVRQVYVQLYFLNHFKSCANHILGRPLEIIQRDASGLRLYTYVQHCLKPSEADFQQIVTATWEIWKAYTYFELGFIKLVGLYLPKMLNFHMRVESFLNLCSFVMINHNANNCMCWRIFAVQLTSECVWYTQRYILL